MRAKTAAVICLVGIVSFLAFWPAAALPQGSGSSRSAPPGAARPPARPLTPDVFYAAFWKHLNRKESPYNKWPQPAGKEGLRKGESPHHGEFLKTYANKPLNESLKQPPYGAIIVMENYAEDEKTLQNITVMYRTRGSDPKHFDWYWLQYEPNGAISRTAETEGKKAVAGKVASCIECHTKAAGEDFLFFNDEPTDEGK